MIERPTVLLADRSESFLMYLSILLNRMDYEVLPVGDGKSLLKMARAIQPGLIALGPDIPGSSPIEIMRLCQEDDDLKEIPVLIADEASKEHEYRAAGCSAFLAKPIEIEQLYTALSQIGNQPGFRRKHLRADFHKQVVMSRNDQVIKCQGITLSEGGIFIRRRTPFPQGCLLKIEIPGAKQQTLTLDGEVIYTKQVTEDRFTMPPGMAIRFLDVNDTDRLALRTIIKSLLIGDLLEEQDEPVLKG
jgi:two-component system cell cycle response regulator DivK